MHLLLYLRGILESNPSPGVCHKAALWITSSQKALLVSALRGVHMELSLFLQTK